MNGEPISNYQYDQNGNRIVTEEDDSVKTATYDDQDRLISFGANTYAYGANGELASKIDGSLALTQYGYDAYGTLTSVVLPGKTIAYGIDPEGRRVERKVNGVTTANYIWDGPLKLIAMTNAAGVVTRKFIYTDSHVPDYMEYQGGNYLFVKDHRGSIISVLNASSGLLLQSSTYAEWGAVLTDTNPGIQPFGWAGGVYDPDTKLIKFGARDYDPETGRWTSKDPILFNGQMTNLYGYSFNDPVNFIDPDGKNPLLIIAGPALAGQASIAK